MGAIASQITSLTIVYSTVYSDADQRKHQSSASLAFVWGIHRDRWIPRTKGQLRGPTPVFRHSRNWRYLVTTQVAPFDDKSSQETWHSAFPSLGNFTGFASLTQQEESDYLPSLTTHHKRACSITFQGALCLSPRTLHHRSSSWLTWLWEKYGFTPWWKAIMPTR